MRRSVRITNPRGSAVDALLAAAVALLALFGKLFGRRKEAPKVKARLSETEDVRYREWARGEAEG